MSHSPSLAPASVFMQLSGLVCPQTSTAWSAAASSAEVITMNCSLKSSAAVGYLRGMRGVNENNQPARRRFMSRVFLRGWTRRAWPGSLLSQSIRLGDTGNLFGSNQK